MFEHWALVTTIAARCRQSTKALNMHTPLVTDIPTTTNRSSGGGGILVISAIVAALGSLLFGFDTAVISGTTEALRQVYTLNDNLLGFTVSSALLGTMVGSLLVGRPADWWGRRPVLAMLAVLFVIAALGCALAWNWYALLFFRWLGGVADRQSTRLNSSH